MTERLTAPLARDGLAPVLVEVLPHAADLPLPEYATERSAGLDLLAAVAHPVDIISGCRALIPTGLRLSVPAGCELQIRPRSGLALRHGITVPNAPGTIDEDYRGEVGIIVLNTSNEVFTVTRGMRIAQCVLARVERRAWLKVDALDETERGAGGFGSTGQ